jgi:hypothetical protein
VIEICSILINSSLRDYHILSLIKLISYKQTSKNALVILKDLLWDKNKISQHRNYIRKALVCLLDVYDRPELFKIVCEIVRITEENKLHDCDLVLSEIKKKLALEDQGLDYWADFR